MTKQIITYPTITNLNLGDSLIFVDFYHEGRKHYGEFTFPAFAEWMGRTYDDVKAFRKDGKLYVMYWKLVYDDNNVPDHTPVNVPATTYVKEYFKKNAREFLLAAMKDEDLLRDVTTGDQLTEEDKENYLAEAAGEYDYQPWNQNDFYNHANL